MKIQLIKMVLPVRAPGQGPHDWRPQQLHNCPRDSCEQRCDPSACATGSLYDLAASDAETKRKICILITRNWEYMHHVL